MKRILLVHNQASFLERNRSLLVRAGFLVLTAPSAEEALRVCCEQPVDLIISLLDMPGMGGDGLCRLLRLGDGLPGLPFILVSYGSEAEAERAARSGASAWLIKPVRPELLLEQVEKCLDTPAGRGCGSRLQGPAREGRVSSTFAGTACNISAAGVLYETAVHLVQDDLIADLLFAMDGPEVAADGEAAPSK